MYILCKKKKISFYESLDIFMVPHGEFAGLIEAAAKANAEFLQEQLTQH